MTDWFRIISDLERAGWTHARIGKHHGVHPTTITAWKRGIEPRYSDGVKLLELHKRYCSPPSVAGLLIRAI